MVEETIKAIKETENEADEIIRKADATCTEILEKAAKEAKEIKEQTVANAKKQAETELLQVKEEGETLKKKGLREDGTGDRSVKSTGSGKRRGGGIRSHESVALMIREEKKPEKKKGGMQLWQYCRCSESVSAH